MDKKPSLKKYLQTEIMREGYITLDRAYGIAASFGHKQKTVERRLNPSESPMIETCYNEKNHIIGYRHKRIEMDILRGDNPAVARNTLL